MDRREILNELQQIVAITDGKTVSATVAYCPEAARRAKGLIQVIESWPIAFPPAPFVSYQCAERHHGDCQLGFSHSRFHGSLCKCACHDPAEAPQQPAEPTLPMICPACGKAGIMGPVCPHCKRNFWGTDPDAPHQPAEPAPAPKPIKPFEEWRKQQESGYKEGYIQALGANRPAARHIDTPDELLELLAGVSSDPQIEGLSLSQKASTMALLYAAKALQVIANVRDQTEDWEKWAVRNPDFARSFAARLLGAANSQQPPAPAAQSPTSPQEPS